MATGLPEHYWVPQERGRLMQFVAGKVRDEAVREDVVQETLARLISYSRRHAVENLTALARTIATNLINDHFRAAKARPTEEIGTDLACDQPLPEQILMHRQRLDVFTDALKGMPPLRREVLIRRRVRGETCEEIGKALNLSPDAVEKHISRALRQLHDHLEKAEKKRVKYDS
ncbi:sigma-70 family RNA polymerase sigma factor [Asticcacaulis sp. ZE23SCel15]|uniref:RNA polymerase sigma factor n=1 Tax=Asticcacaulis sp. ZE23SCel15 TaxID=3059027 RepID=UPI00265FFC16|nr:sigma-70 family RNA polymerase sigma factor [Asticcacaulis sp. ZE23SCel15]WKL57364.1 sigma-70 family RNA polymerase sigma factor [Asticcacaulis sp. ZE23SCel15]